VVRHCGIFIIVTNYKHEAVKVKCKVHKFLSARGVKININDSKIFKFNFEQTFDFLGFSFKFIKRSKIKQITKKGQTIKPKMGVFVCASNNAIRKLKNEIDFELKFISKSVFKVILGLNFIIQK
jgi:hypothetical protein